jgi:catechol 2,3-dioxygenase-like lactoylglutathione lyase family enzyme
MIQHVALEVRRDRWDACVDFYALVGFERVQPPPSLADRAAWVQRGPTQLHLLHVDEPVVLPRGHVAVVVDEYDATLAALRDAGHDVEPRAEHWGSPRAYVHDPAGNLVELMAFAPDGG